MLISIIITTRNSSSYIENTLIALKNQTNKQFEIIIIDDASDDIESTSNIINKYKKYFKIIFHHNKLKTNASVTRNQGVTYSNGELIAFHDADDIWFPNKVREIIIFHSQIENNYLPLLIYHKVCRIKTPIDNNKGLIIPKKVNSTDIINYLINEDGLIQTSTIVINRATSELVKFNESLNRHQDIQYCIDAYNKKISFNPIDKVLSYWIILDSKINAVKKGANVDFCLSWMLKNNDSFSQKNKEHYIGKVIYFIALKEKKTIKTILYCLKNLGFITTINSLYIFIKVILKKLYDIVKIRY